MEGGSKLEAEKNHHLQLSSFFDTQPEEGDSSLLSWLWVGE